MDSFRAFRIDEKDGRIDAGFREITLDDLTEGEIVVRVSHSTINYKDALAATGKGKILRRFPLNGGVDVAGVKRRMRRSESRKRVAMSVLASRFVRSLVVASSSLTLSCSWLLTVLSSSLSDCSSSLVD